MRYRAKSGAYEFPLDTRMADMAMVLRTVRHDCESQ